MLEKRIYKQALPVADPGFVERMVRSGRWSGGRLEAPQWVQQSPDGGPGGEAPGSSPGF